MKKSLFLLSLISVTLTACSSDTSSETQNNAEVVDASTAWQTDVQPAMMPSSMSQPSYQPQPMPSYQPQPLPTYSQPQPISTGYQNEQVGSCQVVRDAADKPIYAQIQKGCYTDSHYTVGVKDTLFLIGYLTGTSATQIADMNQLNPQAKLPVGKVLRVR